MAYSVKDLTTEWVPGVEYTVGSSVSLPILKELILIETAENGIPVAFMEDELKTGSVFSSEKEKILIMFHPEHSWDYLRFAVRVQYVGTHAFVRIYNLGGSKNIRNDNNAYDGNKFRKMFNALSGHNNKLQQEMMYYSILKDCVNNVLISD